MMRIFLQLPFYSAGLTHGYVSELQQKLGVVYYTLSKMLNTPGKIEVRKKILAMKCVLQYENRIFTESRKDSVPLLVVNEEGGAEIQHLSRIKIAQAVGDMSPRFNRIKAWLSNLPVSSVLVYMLDTFYGFTYYEKRGWVNIDDENGVKVRYV